MKLPGFLLIGLTAVIIAADAQEISTTKLPKTTEVTGTSVHGLTKKTGKPLIVTGTSVHDLTKKTEKPLGLNLGVTGSSVHGLTKKTEKPLVVTGTSVHDLTKKTEKPITGSSVRHLTATENPLGQSEKKAILYVLRSDGDRLGEAKFLPQMLNPMLGTHVVYGYAEISGDELIPADQLDDGPNGGYEQVNKLKEKNPSLETLIAIGGLNNSFIEFTNVIKNQESRLQFINSTMNFLDKHNFSGCTWDIFNDASVESLREAKEHINVFFKDFSAEIEKETKRSGKTKKIQAISIPANEDIIKEFEFKNFIEYLEWINLEAYGMVNDSLNVTQLHSALYPGNNTNEQKTVDWMVEHLLSKDVPKEKLVLGTSSRGRGFELQDPNNSELGDAVVGPCPPGKFTMVPGWLAYLEICPMLNESSVNKVFLEKEKVDVVSINTTWISYDGKEAIAEKVNYVKEEGLAGYSVSVGSDDFSGKFCNEGLFPLTRTLYDTLKGSVTGSVTGKVRGSVTGKVTGGVTGSHPPLTKILERSTTLVHKMETTTIKK